MAPKSKSKTPSPSELLAEVKGQPAAKTYPFEEYLDVVHELKMKHHSYAEIADFLSKRLGMEIKRGQVYRAYLMWLEDKAEEAQRAAEDREQELPEPISEAEYIAGAEAHALEQLIAILDEKFSKGPLDLDSLLGRARSVLAQRENDEREAEEADRVAGKK